ncbi:MAG TPA: glycosyltransferase [Thermoleophilaceae bacterium]
MSAGLVHDYLLVMRGAERTFAAMADCWPDAPVYTLLYDSEECGASFDGRDVHTSYLQHLRPGQRGFRRLLPLFPAAAERLPVQQHDLIISSSSAFAHGVTPAPGATHVCYCHSPFRYVWHEEQRALDEAPRVLRPFLPPLLRRLRNWDVRASTRVTHFIANSEITRERIERFWGRDSVVIHPPVDVRRFAIDEPEGYLLVVCELVRHKRVERALDAARRAGRRMKVVGSGPDRERLERLYGGYAEFLGRLSDDELTRVYSRADALVVPNVEEFGIAAVEAMAAGRPVVGLDAGGTRETVIDGETGVLVPPDDAGDALAEALAETDFQRFSPDRIRAHAMGFSTRSFMERLSAYVEELTGLESRMLPNEPTGSGGYAVGVTR